MLKNILKNFHGYFHNLEIFDMKFITKIQFCMKKIIIYFSSIEHYIISYISKLKVQIPLVSGEIKKRNLIRGRLDQLK
jgi:hypothetical protein